MYLSGNTSQLNEFVSQLTRIKQQSQQELLARKQKEADTDYTEECAMWVAVLVAVVNIAILFWSFLKNSENVDGPNVSLKENLNTLQTYNQESEERNWQLSGLSAISHSLQDQESPQDIARKITCYPYRTPRFTSWSCVPVQLQQNASWNGLLRLAYRPMYRCTFCPTEGLVGQAVARSENADSKSGSNRTIGQLKSGSGEAQPGQLCWCPYGIGKIKN